MKALAVISKQQEYIYELKKIQKLTMIAMYEGKCLKDCEETFCRIRNGLLMTMELQAARSTCKRDNVQA